MDRLAVGASPRVKKSVDYIVRKWTVDKDKPRLQAIKHQHKGTPDT